MRALLVLGLCLIPVLGFAQVQSTGNNFTPGHTLRAMNSQGTVIGDAGGAAGSKTAGQGYLTELGITNSGTPLCVNDALTTGPYHQLCLGAGGTGITYAAFGGASQLPLQCVINGVTTPCVGATTVGSVILTGPGTAYSNSNPAAVVAHISDRLLIGNNTQNYNGSNLVCTSAPGSGCSWVGSTQTYTGIYAYLERESMLLGYSQTGEMSAFFATKTSDTVTHGMTCCAQGVSTFVLNDATGGNAQAAWGSYHTAVRASGAGTLLGTEWDIGNLGSVVTLTPYALPGGGGETSDLWVACGGELNSTSFAASLNPCSTAMYILWNGSPFDKGIVFSQTALSLHGSVAYALTFANNQIIRWSASASDVSDGFLNSTVSTDADANGLTFTNFGATFLNASGGVLASIAEVTSVTNTGIVTLGSIGTDAAISVGNGNGGSNQNLQLAANGTGSIQINSIPQFVNATTGASTLVINNSPCTGGTSKWVPVKLSGSSGTWYLPACQ